MADELKWVLGIVAAIALLMIFMGKLDMDIHIQAVLPPGQTYTDSGCTFISNADITSTYTNAEELTDFSATGAWVAIDSNSDGIKEGYGHTGSGGSTVSCTESITRKLITYTPGGLPVIYCSGSTCNGFATAVYICKDGYNFQMFTSTGTGATDAILTCGTTCTPNCVGKCGGVSDGCTGTCNMACGGTCATLKQSASNAILAWTQC